MLKIFQTILRGFAFLAFAAGAHAAPFEAPAEENPPFRRDLLPIDADSMAALSGDLSVLVHGMPLKTPAERRAAAQSLALALALDPANSGARDTISALGGGNLLPPADPAKLTKAKARLWQIHAWLKTPEAGADGNLLGDMVGDAASVLDPSNPVATVLSDSPEKGQWADWVAPLSAFGKNAVAKNDTDPFEDIEPDMPAPDVPAEGKPSIALEAASVSSVLFVFDEESESWELRPATVEMTATPVGSGAFAVAVAGVPPSVVAVAGVPAAVDPLRALVSLPIRAAVEAYHVGLPGDGLVSLTTNGGGNYSFPRNRTNMTGPGFILANSAITGAEPDATVIARLDDGNALVAPEFCWRLVSALTKGKGGRLVVPPGTEEYFTAMLTLENPGLLLKYEVLVASTPKEFMEFCAKVPSVKNAAAFASFQEIKAKAQGTGMGAYLANRFVRQRLQEIVDALPNHLSAKLLAIQGAGGRPRLLTRKVLAAEIWRAIAPIESLARLDVQLAEAESVAEMDKLYESMRADLDNVERYADTSDRDLVTEGKDVTATVRTLARALRGRTDDLRDRYRTVIAAHRAMVAANTALLIKLTEISGEQDAVKAGATKRERRKRELQDSN